MNDDLDMIFSDDSPSTFTRIEMEAINEHLQDIKRLADTEGEICLLKIAIEAEISMSNDNATSDLNLMTLYEEHNKMGPFFDPKPTPDYTRHLKGKLQASETERTNLSEIMLESRRKLDEMLSPSSAKSVHELLRLTQNDIKTNVGQVNGNIFRNMKMNHALNKKLRFRWGSFLKDTSISQTEIVMSGTLPSSSSGYSTNLSSPGYSTPTASSSTENIASDTISLDDSVYELTFQIKRIRK